MRRTLFITLLAALLLGHTGCAGVNGWGPFTCPLSCHDQGSLVETIAFGSCNNENLPQPLWPVISRHQPQVFIWSGDVIYADTVDPIIFADKYEKQRNNSNYKEFLATGVKVLGVWDDHDYGLNNGGGNYPAKDISQTFFLDFLNVPKDSPRRLRKGVYSSHTIGPRGRQIKIIFLDARYHRDDPGPDGDMLGEMQWEWLEEQLTNSSASIHVLVSGIQVLPSEHRFEKWANFPKSKDRLFRLLSETKVNGVIFISGDRHIAEISQLSKAESPTDYPLYDVTSSGLTHSYTSFKSEQNKLRLGSVFSQKHFGVINIDWSARPVALEILILDEENKVQIREMFPLTSLSR